MRNHPTVHTFLSNMLCEKRETRNEKCARLRSPEPRPALKPETRNKKWKRGGLGISERLWETRSRKREMRNEKRAICSPGFCLRLKRETRNVKSEASQILARGRNRKSETRNVKSAPRILGPPNWNPQRGACFLRRLCFLPRVFWDLLGGIRNVFWKCAV